MKWLITSLGLIAAVLVILGGLTTSWWSQAQDGLSASIGLREARVCKPDRCANTPIHNLEGNDSWMRAGVASYTAALLAGGLLLALAALVALGRASKLINRTALVASVTALVAGLGFVFTMPEFDGMSASYSAFLYFIGAGVGAVTSVLALRHRGPAAS